MERTVVVEKLSPRITDPKVVQAAIEQFAAVSKVEIPKNVFDPGKTLGIAVVELETEDGAKNVLHHIREFLLMIGGMPRPVSARPAVGEPSVAPPTEKSKPQPRLVSRDDPEFSRLSKLKRLRLLHAEQRKVLQRMQRSQQENLESELQKLIQRQYKMLQDCEKAETCLIQLRNLYSEDC